MSATPAAASAAAAAYECRDYSGRDFISVLRPNFRTPTSTDRKVLGISGGSKANKARAIIADYHGDPNQRWDVRACSIDDFNQTFWLQLKNGKSNKEQYTNGAELVQWDCAPNAWDVNSHTQQWNTT